MYTGVADRLEDEKQMDDYQREILEKALHFYERFALPQSRDQKVGLEAVKAGLRVSAIRSRLGQTAAAEEAIRQAKSVADRIVSEGERGRLIATRSPRRINRSQPSSTHRNAGPSSSPNSPALAIWTELARPGRRLPLPIQARGSPRPARAGTASGGPSGGSSARVSARHRDRRAPCARVPRRRRLSGVTRRLPLGVRPPAHEYDGPPRRGQRAGTGRGDHGQACAGNTRAR